MSYSSSRLIAVKSPTPGGKITDSFFRPLKKAHTAYPHIIMSQSVYERIPFSHLFPQPHVNEVYGIVIVGKNDGRRAGREGKLLLQSQPFAPSPVRLYDKRKEKPITPPFELNYPIVIRISNLLLLKSLKEPHSTFQPGGGFFL